MVLLLLIRIVGLRAVASVAPADRTFAPEAPAGSWLPWFGGLQHVVLSQRVLQLFRRLGFFHTASSISPCMHLPLQSLALIVGTHILERVEGPKRHLSGWCFLGLPGL